MSDVVSRNIEATNNIFSANKMMNTTISGSWQSYDKTKLFTIAHISDLHNDGTCYENFLTYIAEFPSLIDYSVVSGDIVDTPTSAQYANMLSKETAAGITPIKCIGNHEKYAGSVYMSNADIYTSLNMNTNTGKLYYYLDDVTYKIRIIVLNQYDIDEEIYRTEHFTQEQISWFISALKGAITNEYAVLVVLHACESNGSFPIKKASITSGGLYNARGKSITDEKSSFYQRFKQWEGMTDLQNVCSGTPIEDIINAFKNGASINETYTFSDTSSSITVNDSFTASGTFIAYLNGHNHGDFIGTSSKYTDQIYLNVASGNRVYGNVSDLQRKNGEKSEDVFNVYVIDQDHKLIKVIRVGSDVNDIMQNRKTSVYSYA